MKKIFAVLILLSICFCLKTYAGAIKTTKDGTKIKCSATKIAGSIEEYNKKTIDTYTFKNNKAYNRNMVETFARSDYKRKQGDYAPFRTKITDDKIIIRDYYSTPGALLKKVATIDRKTGSYVVEATKTYRFAHHYHRNATLTGMCSVVK